MNTTNTARRLHSLIPAALLSVISLSDAALPAAASGIEPPTVAVKFGGPDVSDAKGAAALYNRIHAAAGSVCSEFKDRRNLQVQMQLKACINKAIEDAVINVNAPALIAVYSAKTGKALPSRVASLQGR